MTDSNIQVGASRVLKIHYLKIASVAEEAKKSNPYGRSATH
jgi:hypothetical protein